jgi:hypothetical protein
MGNAGGVSFWQKDHGPGVAQVRRVNGLTVTVIMKSSPVQPPDCENGVTMYSTVPGVVPVLVRRSLMFTRSLVVPVPSLAPIILPVMFPGDHSKLEGIPPAVVSLMLVREPVQMVKVGEVVITGTGLTVTVTDALPIQAGEVTSV